MKFFYIGAFAVLMVMNVASLRQSAESLVIAQTAQAQRDIARREAADAIAAAKKAHEVARDWKLEYESSISLTKSCIDSLKRLNAQWKAMAEAKCMATE